jgi:hypothetical protein
VSCVLPSLFISIKIVNFALWCVSFLIRFLVYYEARKRELNIRLIYECRCDERLNDSPHFHYFFFKYCFFSGIPQTVFFLPSRFVSIRTGLEGANRRGKRGPQSLDQSSSTSRKSLIK